tara:strand:- start:14798 stop:16252 length:1455 start_codon:yes stop_codon:yes gene_type:complete
MSVVKEKIIKNVKWLSLTVIVTKLIKLCTFLLIAKTLLPATYGKFIYILSIINLCYIFSDLGIKSVLQKEFFIKSGTQDLTTLLLTRVLLSSAGLLISILLPLIVITIQYSIPYILLLIFVYISHIKEFFFIYARFENKSELEFFTQSLEAIVQFLSILSLFIFINPSLKNIAIAYILGVLSSGSYFLFRFIPNLKKLSWGYNTQYIKFTAASYKLLAISSIFSELFKYIDSIIIKHVLDFKQLGLFDMAKKIFELPNNFSGVLFKSVIPSLSQFQNNREKFSRVFERNLILLAIIYVPVIGTLTIIDRPMLQLFLSENYWPSIEILSYFWVLLFLIPIKKIAGTSLVLFNRLLAFSSIISISATIGTILLPICLTRFSLFGAIFSSIISSILRLVMSLWSLRSILALSRFFFISLLKMVTASTVSLTGVIVLSYFHYHWLLICIWINISFFTVLFLCKDKLTQEYKNFIFKNLSRFLKTNGLF